MNFKKILIMLGTGVSIFSFLNLNFNVDARIPDEIKHDTMLEYDDESFHSSAKKYGFNIETDWKAYCYNVNKNELISRNKSYKEKDILNHFTTLDEALLQSKTCPDYYAYIYRITVNPKQVRYMGFLGIGSYGDNWYFDNLVTECILPDGYNMISYAPEITPEKSEPSNSYLSAGYKELQLQISCVFSYSNNELTFNSKSDYLNQYYTSYKAKRRSEFCKSSSCYYGMFVFKYSGDPKITIKHNIQYYGTYYKCNANGKISFSSIMSKSR